MVSRCLPERRLVLFTCNVVEKCPIYVVISWQFSLIYLANMLCYEMITTKLQGVGDKFAMGPRHPRRLCDYFVRNFVV